MGNLWRGGGGWPCAPQQVRHSLQFSEYKIIRGSLVAAKVPIQNWNFISFYNGNYWFTLVHHTHAENVIFLSSNRVSTEAQFRKYIDAVQKTKFPKYLARPSVPLKYTLFRRCHDIIWGRRIQFNLSLERIEERRDNLLQRRGKIGICLFAKRNIDKNIGEGISLKFTSCFGGALSATQITHFIVFSEIIEGQN